MSWARQRSHENKEDGVVGARLDTQEAAEREPVAGYLKAAEWKLVMKADTKKAAEWKLVMKTADTEPVAGKTADAEPVAGKLDMKAAKRKLMMKATQTQLRRLLTPRRWLRWWSWQIQIHSKSSSKATSVAHVRISTLEPHVQISTYLCLRRLLYP